MKCVLLLLCIMRTQHTNYKIPTWTFDLYRIFFLCEICLKTRYNIYYNRNNTDKYGNIYIHNYTFYSYHHIISYTYTKLIIQNLRKIHFARLFLCKFC